MRSIFMLILLLISANISFGQAGPDCLETAPLNKRKLYTAIAAGATFYGAGLSYLQFVWYSDKERVPFHFYNDAAGYQQIDKLGHAYGAYLGSYIGYHWLKSAGVSRKKSLIYGGGLGLVLLTPIEVYDGLYKGWGFSWPDMAANTAGAALVVGNELLFREQLVKYKFSFSPSPYREQAHGYLGDTALESLFLDYNAHTYWLSLPANKLLFRQALPDWFSLSLGYSANGMYGEFKNRLEYKGQPIPPADRYRQFLVSADVDWTRIPTRSRFLKHLFRGMTFIKLPFPALEINRKEGMVFRPLYY